MFILLQKAKHFLKRTQNFSPPIKHLKNSLPITSQHLKIKQHAVGHTCVCPYIMWMRCEKGSEMHLSI